jgi:hypothetical protein
MTSVNTQRLRNSRSGIAIKRACIAGTTANITLSAEQTIDGIALVDGDRCLGREQRILTVRSMWPRARSCPFRVER